jgi:hypothetical protein
MSPSSGTLKSHLTRTTLPVVDEEEEEEKTRVNITIFFRERTFFPSSHFAFERHFIQKTTTTFPGEDFVVFLTPHQNEEEEEEEEKNDPNARASKVCFLSFHPSFLRVVSCKNNPRKRKPKR